MKTNTETAAIFGGSSVSDVSFIRKICGLIYTVACDSGYYHFLKAECEPDSLVGDFDTLNQSMIKTPGNIIKLNPIKDDTDVFFAVKNLVSRGYKNIHLFGCLGQKIDHTIGNIQILSYLKDQGINSYLYTADNENVLFILNNEEFHFRLGSQGRISVFSLDNEAKGVDEKNLKYTLNNAVLSNSVPLGVSNEFIPQSPKEAVISVKEGKLLIFSPIDSLPALYFLKNNNN
ncbi:MAG: thiamine diphosphokinase [Bacilli bacterium]